MSVELDGKGIGMVESKKWMGWDGVFLEGWYEPDDRISLTLAVYCDRLHDDCSIALVRGEDMDGVVLSDVV